MHTDTPAPIAVNVLREPDAAVYVGLSRAYLRQARMYGRGPAFVRIGRAVLYRRDDLDRFLTEHRVDTRNA